MIEEHIERIFKVKKEGYAAPHNYVTVIVIIASTGISMQDITMNIENRVMKIELLGLQ
jgi:hypothetical protein